MRSRYHYSVDDNKAKTGIVYSADYRYFLQVISMTGEWTTATWASSHWGWVFTKSDLDMHRVSCPYIVEGRLFLELTWALLVVDDVTSADTVYSAIYSPATCSCGWKS